MNLLDHLDQSPVTVFSFCIQGKCISLVTKLTVFTDTFHPISFPVKKKHSGQQLKLGTFHQAYVFSPLTPPLGSLLGDI